MQEEARQQKKSGIEVGKGDQTIGILNILNILEKKKLNFNMSLSKACINDSDINLSLVWLLKFIDRVKAISLLLTTNG